MKILAIIPAYNAEATIQRAVDSLNNQITKHQIDVVVVDDCSTDKTHLVKGAKVIRNIVNIGCYQSINKALNEYIKNYDAWLIHGADDYSAPERISEQVAYNDLAVGCFYMRKLAKFGDSTILYKKKVFDILGYYDNSRFGADSEYRYRYNKYIKNLTTVFKCLYFTNGAGLTKKYRPQTRLKYMEKFKSENIIKRDYFNEKVTIGIASVNQNLLEKTINSLINQCDEMIIGLNNYKKIPKYLKQDKIKCYLLDNKLGDAAKFHDIDKIEGWYLSCDDDLIYPKNYVSYMIEKSKKHKTLVTAHGRKMNKGKLASFYKGHSKIFNCLNANEKDVKIDIAGSGVACFHTSMANVKLKDFRHPNMSDIYLSSYFDKIICVKHSKYWLTYQHHEDRIFATYRNKDTIQTNEYNRLFTTNP